jgi:hypothetical protein
MVPFVSRKGISVTLIGHATVVRGDDVHTRRDRDLAALG